jgi:hypothetical protein
MGTARARHGMCESNTAALCKSNGKDTVEMFYQQQNQILPGHISESNFIQSVTSMKSLNPSSTAISSTDCKKDTNAQHPFVFSSLLLTPKSVIKVQVRAAEFSQ